MTGSRAPENSESKKTGRVAPLMATPERYDETRIIVASLDWSQYPAVESVPGKVSGAWVLPDTRTPVKVLFENLEAGMSIDDSSSNFPSHANKSTA